MNLSSIKSTNYLFKQQKPQPIILNNQPQNFKQREQKPSTKNQRPWTPIKGMRTSERFNQDP